MNTHIMPPATEPADAMAPLGDDELPSFDPYFLPSRPDALAFPVGSLPKALRPVVSGAAVAWGTHESYVATAAIVVTLGLVGQRARLRVSTTHTQTAALMGFCIGATRTGKSQALRRFTQLGAEIEREETTLALPDFSDPVIRIEMQARERRYRKAVDAAIESDDEPPRPDPVLLAWLNKRGSEPLIVTAGSAEGLESAAKFSHHGIIVLVDEAAEYLGGMGGQRRQQVILSGFDGVHSRKQLAGGGGDEAGRPVTISFVGATTPRSLKTTGLLDGKGVAGRSIVAVEHIPSARRQPTDEEIAAAEELLKRVRTMRHAELPPEIGFSQAAVDLIARTASGWQERARLEPPAIQDALNGVDAILYRMAAAIYLLTYPDAGQHTVSAEAARAAIALYVRYYKPSLAGLASPEETAMRDLVLQFVGLLLERMNVDRINRREFQRRRNGVDMRGFSFEDFEFTLMAKGIATVEDGAVARRGGRPEKLIVLNPDYVARYRAATAPGR